MKLIHLSDLHLGIKVSEFSLIDDQRYILEEIQKIIDGEKPDGVIIAGDVYDKSVPSTEAVELFDEFLVKLAEKQMQVYIISGNHDSAERLAFASSLIGRSGVHLSPVYRGKITPLCTDDEYGKVNIYMLPFIKPAHVKTYLSGDEKDKIITYTDAVSRAIADMNVNRNERNVLIAHQFVTGAALSESEDITVGGLDNVDADVFEPFDYTALGHIHSPQDINASISCGKIRYCGTPLKYSFSEADQEKSVTIAELKEKGNVSIKTIPLTPKRDMMEIKGTYEHLVSRSFYEKLKHKNDFYRITLTDENNIPDAVARLRTVYPNILRLDYDSTRTRTEYTLAEENTYNKTPAEIFSDLFRQQNGRDMSDEQNAVILRILDELE